MDFQEKNNVLARGAGFVEVRGTTTMGEIGEDGRTVTN